MKIKMHIGLLIGLLAISTPTLAISFTPVFPASGEGGAINGQDLTVGVGGAVFEVDAFVSIPSEDLNGGGFGTSAQLSSDSLPTGLDFTFGAGLSSDNTDLTLSYTFTNNTGSVLPGFKFLSFLDSEIDVAQNDFFNEFATTSGTLSPGQSFEVDEPGYVFGDIFDNLLFGTLDGMNALPNAVSSDDVSMALAFDFISIGVGDIASIDIMISEDGDSLGAFFITQHDSDPGSATTITYSGLGSVSTTSSSPSVSVPEPATFTLLTLGIVMIAARKN